MRTHWNRSVCWCHVVANCWCLAMATRTPSSTTTDTVTVNVSTLSTALATAIQQATGTAPNPFFESLLTFTVTVSVVVEEGVRVAMAEHQQFVITCHQHTDRFQCVRMSESHTKSYNHVLFTV